ncbi:hypothetical protein MTBLM5_70037 [Magnetospirillum sp. LM-5]|nr:hypothetical protein MTBLM5_70037 [Magnetospirillum sp. LM-5]
MPRLLFEECSSAELATVLPGRLKRRENDAGEILVKADFQEDDIVRALRAPFRGGIQLSADGESRLGEYFLAHVRDGGIGLSLCTGAAYDADVAGPFVQALWRLAAAGPADEAICLAVHEALANALVHGNLEVPRLDEDLDAFLGHCQLLEDAKSDPARWGRRIEISGIGKGGDVEVAIQDQGLGYQVHGPATGKAGHRLHGLELINACTSNVRVEDGGRCLVLVFATQRSDES